MLLYKKLGVRKIILILSLLLPFVQVAAEDSGNDTAAKTETKSKVVTGFTGGMLLHGGYLFAKSPDELFRNASLDQSLKALANLPTDGFTYGLGGTLRLHFLDHIHFGAEGYVSNMPLMKSGSNLRTGWGDVYCDIYMRWGRFMPLAGVGIGGGSTKRLYVPADKETVNGEIETTYNSSYTKTPFFLIVPYIGAEITLTSHINLIVKADWLLPFGSKTSGLNIGQMVSWSNYLAPSGPRIYVGVLFGKK